MRRSVPTVPQPPERPAHSLQPVAAMAAQGSPSQADSSNCSSGDHSTMPFLDPDILDDPMVLGMLGEDVDVLDAGFGAFLDSMVAEGYLMDVPSLPGRPGHHQRFLYPHPHPHPHPHTHNPTPHPNAHPHQHTLPNTPPSQHAPSLFATQSVTGQLGYLPVQPGIPGGIKWVPVGGSQQMQQQYHANAYLPPQPVASPFMGPAPVVTPKPEPMENLQALPLPGPVASIPNQPAPQLMMVPNPPAASEQQQQQQQQLQQQPQQQQQAASKPARQQSKQDLKPKQAKQKARGRGKSSTAISARQAESRAEEGGAGDEAGSGEAASPSASNASKKRGSSGAARQADTPSNGRKPRSSSYRGVTKHRRSGRWEAHIWVKEVGRQVYLGGYEQEEHAAEAYDVATLKVKGKDSKGIKTNFDTSRYADLLECMDSISLEELIMAVRRQSQGFSRGSSTFRGVTAHPSGRWEARIGIPGSKHIYLGLFDLEEDAARAYDRALVRLRGTNAATNNSLSEYKKELAEHFQQQPLLLTVMTSQAGNLEFERWIKNGNDGLDLPAGLEGLEVEDPAASAASASADATGSASLSWVQV